MNECPLHKIIDQGFVIDRTMRARQKDQRPFCVWLTGLSGAGKTTLAEALDRRLYALGKHTFVIDGDSVRQGLNCDLKYSQSERSENVRRVAHVARMMVDAGLIVIVALISPLRCDRRLARGCFQLDEFFEVFVDTPIEICESRDAKGLYSRARSGLIANLTGIDAPYERPDAPEAHIDPGPPGGQSAYILTELHRRKLIALPEPANSLNRNANVDHVAEQHLKTMICDRL